jgi:hypothetical protein
MSYSFLFFCGALFTEKIFSSGHVLSVLCNNAVSSEHYIMPLIGELMSVEHLYNDTDGENQSSQRKTYCVTTFVTYITLGLACGLCGERLAAAT